MEMKSILKLCSMNPSLPTVTAGSHRLAREFHTICSAAKQSDDETLMMDKTYIEIEDVICILSKRFGRV